uniref:Uncharacterized protein n=1 Tax=Acrobeloides nanus TaxID=290746 RepID=A0A914C856_9BILA
MRIYIEFINSDDHFGALTKACKLVESDKVVAIFGPADIMLNKQLKELTDAIEVPFFSINDDFTGHELLRRKARSSENDSSSEISMFPKAQLSEALSDLIKHWRWNRVTIVYVETERVRRLIPFVERELYNGIRFHFVRANRNNFLEATRQIKSLEDCANVHQKECSEFSRILIDMDPQDTYNFLLAALQMGFIELKHWFLITSMDIKSMDFDLFRHNHARYIGVNPVDPEFLKSQHQKFDFEAFQLFVRREWEQHNGRNRNLCPSQAAIMFDAVYLAAHSVHGFGQIYPLQTDTHSTRCRTSTRSHVKSQAGRRLIEHIRNTTLYGLTGDLSRIGNPHQSNFSFRINLLGYNGDIDDIGFWAHLTDVSVNMSRDSRAQLQKNVKVSDELKPHFRVTTILERPCNSCLVKQLYKVLDVMLKKNHFELDSNNQFEGFCIDLLEELSKDLGVTYTIHVVRDNKYGNDIHGNGTWDGMIGEILNGEADMAVAPFTVNFRRAEVVDFTKPFLSLGISILFKIPADHQPNLFSFLNPLSLEIWFCILIAIVGLTIGMYCIAQLTPYEWNLNFSCCTAHQPHPAAKYYTESETLVQLSNNYSFWNTLCTMLKGGCDFGPRAVSTRLLGGTWWVFTLVIVSAYTANLAAVLTVSRPYIPIRNLDDLANQTKISYGTVRGGSTMQFFQESKINSHIKMWNYMKNRDVFVKSNSEGVNKVTNENYAFLMESTSLEYEVQQNCNLTQIGGVLGSKGYGIALQKKSEWTDRISRQILLYQKRGIIEMKKTKWWRSKGAACAGVGSALKQQRISLNLYNVSGLFLILFAGLLFSAITVMIEFCIRSKEIAQRDKKPFLTQLIRQLVLVCHRNRKPVEGNENEAYHHQASHLRPGDSY